MLNRTRQLYNQIVGNNKPTVAQRDDSILAAEQLEDLLKHPGYKRLQEWMETQKDGSREYMQHEVQNVSVVTFFSLFNVFAKYLFFLLENRAYGKIDAFIRVSIQKGKKYAEERARQEAREAGKATRS